MTGLSLITKGKICQRPREISYGGGSGIIYRDREIKKQLTKQECEELYFPKVKANLIRILRNKCFSIKVKLSNDEPDKL